jgi:hypothetical protein
MALSAYPQQQQSSRSLFFHNYLLARLYFFIAVHNWRKRAIKEAVVCVCVKEEKNVEGHKTRAAAAAENFFDAC